MEVRANRESWLGAAFSALAEGGADRVRVEVLAKQLHVTKGSFYWHFRDRNELMDTLLDSWKTGRIEAIKRQTQLDGTPAAERLRSLLSLYLDGSKPRGIAIELAMRDWARREPKAASAVAEVDQERLHCVSALFSALGLTAEEAFARAYLFYSFIFGEGLLVQDRASPTIDTARRICAGLLVPGGGMPVSAF
ncbi:MAG TPA: TetR/AcrR family transcriptional regulator [Azospirillum sp.]